MKRLSFLSCICLYCLYALSFADPVVYEVIPTVETDPVPHSGDRADDAKIWLHPDDPAQSVIIGSDKDDSNGGIIVYDLNGKQLHIVNGGKMNNIDIRYNFDLGGKKIDIVATGNRTDNTIAVFSIDPQTRNLTDIVAEKIHVNIEEAYGFCLYKSMRSRKLYAFVNDKNGEVEQWELYDNGQGKIAGTAVRRFDVGTQTEGMTADDLRAFVYIGEEDVALWRYPAEPDAPADSDSRYMVDTTGPSGHIAADIEGMTIYHGTDGTGYLIASSQGEGSDSHPLKDTFSVYRREGDNEFIMSFRIIDNPDLDIDDVENTDGVGVINTPLGPAFPFGAFVAQDGSNSGGNQNYKLVPWQNIAEAINHNLLIDTTYDPRNPCSSGAFLQADLTKDCIVDYNDLVLLAAQWLQCNLIPPSACNR